jgi:AcrR family transcriptional regulator
VTKGFDAESRRAQLLACAMAVFAASGYEAARTTTIAEAAGVSERLLYKHFASKQELFVAVMAEVAEGVAEECRQGMSRPELSLADALSISFERRFGPGGAASGRPLVLGRSYGPFEDPVLNEAIASSQRVMTDAVSRYFAWAAGRGLLRPDVDPEAAAWTWSSILRGHDALRNAYGAKHAHAVAKRQIRDFVEAVSAVPGSAGPPGSQQGPPVRRPAPGRGRSGS